MIKSGNKSFMHITPFLMALFSVFVFGTSFTTTQAFGADEEAYEIVNKSSQFSATISSMDSSSGSSNNDLAEMIRKQREAIEARENAAAFSTSQKVALKNGQNACDQGLRKCMQGKCGSDFSKCALDGDTMFGDKLNLCRKDLTCTGEEFKLFTTEIKADRDMNARLSSYTKTIDCGNRYNDCIQKECGATFNKCLGKAAADRATKNCETLAKNCMEQDSGLSSRFGTVIGRLRETAEKEIKTDEERMYKLRELMTSQCKRLGAMFDQRSFDCVYTVNFYAGEDHEHPTASRKAYAGNTFKCMQEWFGVNVTTYKENAFRETRAQKAASSAMLGSGVGTAAGLITSGAIGRALETQKAKKDMDEAEDDLDSDEEESDDDDDSGMEGLSDEEKAAKKAEKKAERKQKSEERKAKMKENNDKIKDKIKENNAKIKENNAKIKEKLKASNAKAKQGAQEFGQKIKDAFTKKK